MRCRRAPSASVAFFIRALWLVLLQLTAVGCVKAPAGRDVVQDVALESEDTGGAPKAVDADEVLAKLATVRSPRFLGIWDGVLFEYEIYDETVLSRDLERIERFYRARGYYEAKVTAARVFRAKAGSPKVYVELRVREGSPVLTGSVSIPGIEQLPFDVANAALQARKLEPGRPFDEANFEDTKKAIAEVLADRGYAFVKVTGKAQVDVSRRVATVWFQVEPGPLANYGPIRIAGLREVPEDKVRANLRLREGRPYSRGDVHDAQDALVNLGVFASVDVHEDTSHPETRAVPITVTLRESALRAVRLGGGARIDNIHAENHLRVGWEDRNFLGGLRQFSIESRPGVTYYPASFSQLRAPSRLLPESRIRAELRQRSFLEGRTTGFVAGEYNVYPLLYELDQNEDPNLERIIGYHEVRGRLGLERAFFHHHFYVSPSYNWQANFAFTYQKDLPSALNQPVRVAYPELITALDFRDDRLHPKSGFFLSNSLQVARVEFGGNVSDVRIRPEVRLYHSVLRKKITLALRVTTGLLFPDTSTYGETLKKSPNEIDPGDDDMVRDQHKLLFRAFYSGGADSNRGYTYRAVGPQGPITFLVPTGVKCFGSEANLNRQGCVRPLGGLTLWEASFEVRIPVSGPLSVVTFADASNVSRSVATFDFSAPHLSVGPGIRYDTPVGPVRLDIGYRVPGLQKIGASKLPKEDGLASEPFGINGLDIAIHLAFGEAF